MLKTISSGGEASSGLTSADIRMVNEEPRILDLRLAEALGFANLIDIRKLIRRHEQAMQGLGQVFATVAKTSPKGGRPGKEYWLTQKQCLYLTTKSETEKATEITIQVVKAFDALARGDIQGALRAAGATPEDERRVALREQIKTRNKHLASAAKDAGVETPTEFSIFQTRGYQGLYDGRNVSQILAYKGLPKSAKVLDHMDITELAANLFRVTQTEEKLRQEQIQGRAKANQTHFEVGRQVRKAMLDISGIAPENLPPADNIRQAEKRLGGAAPQIAGAASPDVIEPAALAVDIKADLWKYALLVMVQRPGMQISTSDLIAELPSYLTVPEDLRARTASRADAKFNQLVRNLKSHKKQKNNFIHQGYAEEAPRGFKATAKGLAFVKSYFQDRLAPA